MRSLAARPVRGNARSWPRSALGLVLSAALAGCQTEPTVPEIAAAGQPVEVVFLSHAAESGLNDESAAAWEWLRGQATFTSSFVQHLDLDLRAVPETAVLWWHYSDQASLPSSALDPAVLDTVSAHRDRGGALLLSLLATPWLVPLGLESVAPNQVGFAPGTDWARWDPPEDRLLSGFQTYRGHPLLRRFWGSTLTVAMHPERRYATAAWNGDVWPAGGRVVAVGRRYIGLNPERRVIVEYPGTGGAGAALAVGEAMYFADGDNGNRPQLEAFAVDALRYLAGHEPAAAAGARIANDGAPAILPDPAPGVVSDAGALSPNSTAPETSTAQPLPEVLSATTYWRPPAPGTTWREIGFADTPIVDSPADLLERILAARSGLTLEREVAAGDAFDLASPRNLAVGQDTGRFIELWSHPHRILRDLRFGVVTGNDVEWVDEAAEIALTVRPEGNSFSTVVGGVAIDMHAAVPRDQAGLNVVLALESATPVRLRASWTADHAAMWPREADHLGPMRLGYDGGTGTVVWGDAEGRFETQAGFAATPASATVGGRALPGTGPSNPGDDETTPSRQVSIDVDVPAGRPVPVTFAVRAGTNSTDVRSEYLAAHADPAAVWTSSANHWAEFLAETTAIASPDPTLNEAFRWAKVGLEAFRMTTPGMGTGLAAGYAAAKRAEDDEWAATNDFLRRPGYGWYFGRDAVWTTLAADAYGGTDLTEQALRFLARYQDVDGKILHELSPGWVPYYDAADSTPLFLVGLERHIRATGNRELLRELWPSVRAAMAFLERTDRDGDGLIDNTGVGHGWIEGGKFYGAHTTLYLASAWAAAAEAVARMAAWVGDDTPLGAAAATHATRARAAVNDEYWDPVERTFRHGKRADGSYLAHRTILPAVPALLGVADREKIRPMVRTFGSAEITADWGARMAARSNPDYNPVGYHDGSVWPLYTGWTALAAYRARQPLTGFLHAYSNLRLVRHGALGHIPEVLNGEIFESAGVTEHQAWSHALSILPIIDGLLGVRRDAIESTLRVHPQLPGGWRELTAQRIHVGEDGFDITIARGDETSSFTIERVAGNAPIQFDLALPFPRAALVNLDHDLTRGVAIPDGESIVNLATEKQVQVFATLTETTGVVTFRHSAFPEVILPLPAPTPGATSTALRVVESRFTAGALNVRVEALPNRPYRFAIATPWPVATVAGPRGTRAVSVGPGRAVVEVVVPGTGDEYRRADLTVEFIR